MNEPFWVLSVIAGDHAYGLDIPHQAPEIRAVYIPSQQDPAYQLGPEPRVYPGEQGKILAYTLAMFVQRALDCDPAAIEMLYTPPRCILFANAYGQRLLDQRDMFLSLRARGAFADAALRRLQRVEQYRRWRVDPPTGPPTPEAFGAEPARENPRRPDSKAQRAYQAAREEWMQYQVWRRHGDPVRAEREQRYAYDTVDAMHAIRLLAMGAEILETSKVRVYRHDRAWLRSVRDGALLYDELRDLVPVCLARLDRLSRLSSLPERPNVAAAQALVAELEEQYRSGAEQ